MRIYTLGHSTRSLEEFIEILKTFDIELVVDVRRFPGSRKFPHFNMENLEVALPKVNIRQTFLQMLGNRTCEAIRKQLNRFFGCD